VLDNPCNFANPFQFEITFECLQELEEGTFTERYIIGQIAMILSLRPSLSPTFFSLWGLNLHTSRFSKDLEWKVIYVGSAHDTAQDQVLDEILVGPVPVGVNKFVLQADAPNPTALPPDDILGVTVVLVTCSYREREFVRVGYYVNNELLGHDPEQPAPSYPQLDMTMVQRQILADKPRVTKFPIQWGQEGVTNDENHAQPRQQQQQQQLLLQQQQPVPELHSEDPLEKKMAAAMTGPSAATTTTAMETD